MFDLAETGLVTVVEWLRLVIEFAGAMTVAVGAIAALRMAFGAGGTGDRYTLVRVTLARYLALALEFQLAADILTTAVAPGWQEIGMLAATATIRTALNFFLVREVRELERSTPS